MLGEYIVLPCDIDMWLTDLPSISELCGCGATFGCARPSTCVACLRRRDRTQKMIAAIALTSTTTPPTTPPAIAPTLVPDPLDGGLVEVGAVDAPEVGTDLVATRE